MTDSKSPVDTFGFPINDGTTYRPPGAQSSVTGPPTPVAAPTSRPARVLPDTPGGSYTLPAPEPATVPAPDDALVPAYTIPVSLTPAPAPAPAPAPQPALAPASDPAPSASIPEITVTGTRPVSSRQVAPARTAGGSPTVVSAAETPPTVAPDEALQTAKAINTPLKSSYDFAANVLVNGIDIGAPFSFEVSKNNNYQADRYFVELELAAMPKGYEAAFWSSGDQKKVELRCGFKDTKLKTLIVGLIDDSEIDWLTRTLTLRGRDFTSLLIDNKTAEKFPNQTSSQIAELIATRRGLSSKVTKTTTLVGEYFQREHAELSAESSEHDILTYLAAQEGFNYWIDGTTLHFEEPPPAQTKPFVIMYKPPTANTIANGSFIRLKTKRSETLAKDIIVEVISFDPKKGKSIKATAKRSRIKTSSKITKDTVSEHVIVQPYIYRIPGLTKEQAQATANQIAAKISKNERVITVEVPFDPILDARVRLSLRGTGTDFDQPYFIESIEYSASFEAGSRMEITAKNNSPQTQVAL